ncbi:PR domain zinc finger protein 5-like isoform X7 [Bombyx mori]|uniref:Uncharacterized protein n=1 Tax=Bombyx mori TaxID=7091 RepID=A0A8R2R5K5_BOMMO|nr:ferritin isoform X6 [Bombyx mori]
MADKTSEWRPGPTVCRCCLAEGCYKDISTEYFWMGKREVYAEMLAETFSVSIAYSKSGGPNSNSRLICEPCISRLRDASDFKKQVQECEKTFMQYLDPGSSSTTLESEVQTSSTDKRVKVEQVKIERQFSDDEFDSRDFGDDDDDDDMDQPLTTFASKEPKKETVNLMELLASPQLSVKRKAPAQTKTVSVKKVKVIKKDARGKPTTSKAAQKNEDKKKKGPDEDEATEGPTIKIKWKKKQGSNETKVWVPKSKYHDHRDNACIIIECSNVVPFRWKRGLFHCGYCELNFGDIQSIKIHSVVHPNRIEAVRHARTYSNVKIEISDLRCELCLQSMDSVEEFAEHLIDSHGKPIRKEKGLGVTPYIMRDGEFICGFCKTSFSLFTNVNTHINTHSPGCICAKCGKAFLTKFRLSAHLLTHEDESGAKFNCTKCDKTFLTKNLRYVHMSTAHGAEKRYRCPHCREMFKTYDQRRRHLSEVHGQKLDYPCPHCPAVFRIFNQRTKHIRDVHIQDKRFACTYCPDRFVTGARLRLHLVKHIGERKYQCQVCNKAYARPRTLKEHMRIHNNDRRFVCPYCSSAFVQNCSLKGHMRTHHPDAELLKKN